MYNQAKKYGFLLLLMLLTALVTRAEQMPYLCDFGFQGGIGYYVGDAQQHIFLNPREVYGAQFRYKFDNRWALQVKGQYQKIAFKNGFDLINEELAKNDMINLDVVGEFNFMRYGEKSNDSRIKPFTPYIFLGVGAALYGENDGHYNNLAVYLPLGIGFKWRFASRWQLIAAWQHNLYFADDLENITLVNSDGERFRPYSNTYELNGSNILNDDLTGQFTVGIVFEFAKKKGVCKTCSWK